MENDKLVEVLLEEFRLLRQEIKEDGLRRDKNMDDIKKDVNALKTKFMLVAISMGLAGGKISSFLPFLK